MKELHDITNEAKRLEAIINTATDGIITIDERGVISTFNPAAEKLFGWQPIEVIGQKINILMPTPYRASHDEYMRRYQHEGKPRIIGIGREVEGIRKDGTIFPLRLAVSEMYIDGQRLYTGIIHDLTDLKKAEARIRQLNLALEEKVAQRTEDLASVVDKLLNTNQLLKQEIEERLTVESQLRTQGQELQQALAKEKELNALKSRFVSMASHEFRTPLSTILSSAELVQMYQQTEQHPKRLKHIERIKAAVGNLNDILNDFLSLSRLEEGILKAHKETFELAPFLRQLEDDICVLLKTGQFLEFPRIDEQQTLHTDPKFLRNILLNLLSNASKYSDEQQGIYLKVSVGPEAVVFVVADEGMGIPVEDQKHLFTRFFRAHNVENIKGTGLGLHIVQRYLDILGGSIQFTSEMGQGSRFQVTLPQ